MGLEQMIPKKIIVILLALLAVSPLFGVIIADIIDYHEPLDIVAEELGLSENEFTWTPLRDYTFPGLPNWIGYIISGGIGLLAITAVAYILKRLVVVS